MNATINYASKRITGTTILNIYIYCLEIVDFSRDVFSQLSSISGASSTRGGIRAANAGPTAECLRELLFRVLLFTGAVKEGGFLTTQVSRHSTSSAIYNVCCIVDIFVKKKICNTIGTCNKK